MPNLYYFVDPMCSWCYGFSPEMKEIVAALPAEVELYYVMGGLAPDSDEPMPEEMKEYIKHHWQTVAAKTGAPINYDFWTECEPRRSTYPSCRAVIAAGLQGEANIPLMLEAIQKAYYQQARNPSLDQTLVEIAAEIGLDAGQFERDLNSAAVEEKFRTDIKLKYRMGIQGFPTLVLEYGDKFYALTVGYTNSEVVLERLNMVLAGEVSQTGG